MTRVGIALAGVLVVAAAAAFAQNTDHRVVLHEYIEPPAGAAVVNPAAAAGTGHDLFGNVPGAGRNPAAFRRGQKILPRPEAPPRQSSQEPMHGTKDFGADRATEARPDAQTGADTTLHYSEVFNPSVVPFKRMSALDTARADYTLHVYETALEDLPVGGDPTAGRDLFWASLAIQLAPGDDVPIPSVAPDMRILSYETDPPVAVTFSKDGADNYFVRTDDAAGAQAYRLIFLADADVNYFSPQVPEGYRVQDIPRSKVKPLPPQVQRAANRALSTLALTREQDLRTALDTLVYYFRGFEAKQLPPSGDNLYWNLFSNQAGVCRHRSFAFTITANALGIPTRYLSNEAHAWVEVWVPADTDSGGRWLRIDLGGAADTLEVSNASDKAMYRPRREEAFPQPPEYSQNYTRLRGDVRGLTSEQIQEANDILPGQTDSDSASAGTDGSGASGSPPGTRYTVGPGAKLPEMPASAYAGKLPSAIVVAPVAAEGFRGEPFQVTGRLADGADAGIASARVDIYIAPAGFDGEYAVMVGHTVTAEDGAYAATVSIPKNIDLGAYEVYAVTSGTEIFRPALSE